MSSLRPKVSRSRSAGFHGQHRAAPLPMAALMLCPDYCLVMRCKKDRTAMVAGAAARSWPGAWSAPTRATQLARLHWPSRWARMRRMSARRFTHIRLWVSASAGRRRLHTVTARMCRLRASDTKPQVESRRKRYAFSSTLRRFREGCATKCAA